MMNSVVENIDKKIDLSDDTIHVFLLNIKQLNYEDYLFHLSKEEIERANILKIEEKKKQFIITRAMLRKILLKNLNDEEINFLYGEHQKPYIENRIENKTIEFNISHSGDFVLIALTLNNQLGVDIEKIDDIDYQSLSNRFFSEYEKEALNKLEKSNKLDAFYCIWVRKESFIKATGKGVAFGLNNFSVSLDDNKKSKIDIETSQSKNKQWYCHDLMHVEGYKTALTSCNNDAKLIFYQ